MNWNDGLSEPHLTIASSNAKRIAVLAGPGTGKTTYGLLRRIMHLLQEKKVKPQEILFLTFSRTTAEDFREKLGTMGIEEYQNIHSSTIHSFCLEILMNEQVFKSTGRNASRILLSYEEDVMLRDLKGEFGNLNNRKKMLERFSSGWVENPEEYPGKPTTDIERNFQEQISIWLHEHNAMLIGEVVPVAYNFLLSNPTSEFLSKYTNIIVDEFQDLNRLEQAFVELLLGKNGYVCIAGDDDQSIYKFRNAHPRGIHDFYSGSDEKVKIEICGRCPKQILNVANEIKKYLSNSSKGPLVCKDEAVSGNVVLLQWDDNEEESTGIASRIKSEIDKGEREPGDFLILVQSKSLGISMRKDISDLGIECHSYFQEDPISNAEGKKDFTLLQLLVNPQDPIALRYWLGLGDSSARSEQYSKLRELVKSSKNSLHNVLEDRLSKSDNTPEIKLLLKRYVELKKTIQTLNDKTVIEIVDVLFPEGIEVDDLRKIALKARQIAGTPKELLDFMVKEITQPGIPENPDFVRVMSLHKSKGLTSKVVYVAGMVEGILPNSDAYEDEENMQECRRLFYVAVTRAKEELILSSFSSLPFKSAVKLRVKIGKWLKPVNGVKYIRTITSRFITELGQTAPRIIQGGEWLTSKTSNS